MLAPTANDQGGIFVELCNLLSEGGPEWANPYSVGVDCPWCGEAVELLIDPSGGDSQDYVEDCEVCCRPWHISVALDPARGIIVTVEPNH